MSKRHRWTAGEILTAIEMRETGKTWREIGDRLGVDAYVASGNVMRWCAMTGRRHPDAIYAERLKRQVKLMRTNSEKAADIAQATNHSVSWVGWFCKKHNLPKGEGDYSD